MLVKSRDRNAFDEDDEDTDDSWPGALAAFFLRHLRTITLPVHSRCISFTPRHTGRVKISILPPRLRDRLHDTQKVVAGYITVSLQVVAIVSAEGNSLSRITSVVDDCHSVHPAACDKV